MPRSAAGRPRLRRRWPIAVQLLAIEPLALRLGVVGADYSATLTVTDPTATPTWSIESGELPPGISFDEAAGELGDFPTAGGTYPFTVRAEDGAMFGERVYSIVVVKPNLAANDVANELLGAAGTLPFDEVRYLDLIGNNNGTYDVGDFRAYVIDQGLLNTIRGTQ